VSCITDGTSPGTASDACNESKTTTTINCVQRDLVLQKKTALIDLSGTRGQGPTELHTFLPTGTAQALLKSGVDLKTMLLDETALAVPKEISPWRSDTIVRCRRRWSANA